MIETLAAVVLCLVAWAVTRHLPPPRDPDDDVPVPDYPALVRPGRVTATVALAGVLGWWSSTTELAWPHVVWASLGLVLVTIDLATTYLPLLLHRLLAGGTALALTVQLWGDPAAAIRAAAAGALTGVLFWMLWRFGAGFGFGDVRLACWLGAVTGAVGWQHWWWALLGGTMLGAVHGVVVALWRRRHPSVFGRAFAYGPALWAGAWVALAGG